MISTPPNSIDWVSVIRAFAHLFRLPVGILAALAGCATIYALNAATPLQQYLLTATILVCMTSAACAINDYWDLDKDRIDHLDRPLPSGRLSLQQAWWAAVILFGCALLTALPLGLYPFILVAISTVLLWNYSHLLTYSGILGNAIVATIVAALIFLGSLVAERPFAMLYPIWFLFCYALAKEIIWDVHDAEGDHTQRIVTVANGWGDRAALSIAWRIDGVYPCRAPPTVNGASLVICSVLLDYVVEFRHGAEALSAATECQRLPGIYPLGAFKYGVWSVDPVSDCSTTVKEVHARRSLSFELTQ